MNRTLSTRLQKLESDAAGSKPVVLIVGNGVGSTREALAHAKGRPVVWVRTGVPRAGEKSGDNE